LIHPSGATRQSPGNIAEGGLRGGAPEEVVRRGRCGSRPPSVYAPLSWCWISTPDSSGGGVIRTARGHTAHGCSYVRPAANNRSVLEAVKAGQGIHESPRGLGPRTRWSRYRRRRGGSSRRPAGYLVLANSAGWPPNRRTRPGTYPAHRTRGETDVLRLVAKGRSSKQDAESLGCPPQLYSQNHVQNTRKQAHSQPRGSWPLASTRQDGTNLPVDLGPDRLGGVSEQIAERAGTIGPRSGRFQAGGRGGG